ncbi:MAG: L-histidine N(alpha)-methyltransferase [Planctomycetes bacterium]|nr:L-histidine N(alpha)-methyltransferase [Planctomycetota bacterium]
MLAAVTHAEMQGLRAGDPPARGAGSPRFVQAALPDAGDVAPALRRGLAAGRAQIPARFLYDELGSRLFDAITALPEYYPTRTEAALLAEHLPAIAAAVPVQGCTLIDLGAGSCEKAPRLFPMVRPRQYVAVDISVDFLRTALTRLQLEHPAITMLGVGTDFSSSLELPAAVGGERRLFFYPGSSIGNFAPDEAVAFLRRVRERMDGHGALWIGADLQKDRRVLVRAYDDGLGVTAAFNRNILRHVNALAGTDFAPADWRHVARYDEQHGRIEMHLEAERSLTVRWPGGERAFAQGERIHTENSYKYTPDGFRALLERAGLRQVGMWTDQKGWFGFFVAVPA